MQFLNSESAVAGAVIAFAMTYGTNLPNGVGPIFVTAASAPSAVDSIVGIAETLYANQAAVTDVPTKAAARALCAQCAMIGAQYGWQSMANGRGFQIVQAMCRDLGLPPPPGTTWPDPATDPAINPNYVPAG